MIAIPLLFVAGWLVFLGYDIGYARGRRHEREACAEEVDVARMLRQAALAVADAELFIGRTPAINTRRSLHYQLGREHFKAIVEREDA